jgi:hypothetical protein
MRIALASETWIPQVNGVSRTLDRLARSLAASGDQLLVLAPRYEQPLALPEGSEAEGFAALRLPFYRGVRDHYRRLGTGRRDATAAAAGLAARAREEDPC